MARKDPVRTVTLRLYTQEDVANLEAAKRRERRGDSDTLRELLRKAAEKADKRVGK